MRTFLFLLLFGFLSSCQPDASTSSETLDTAQAVETPEIIDPPADGPRATQRTGAGREIPVNENDYIDLKLVGGKVPKGKRICLDVYANRFHNVMSMQYTIQWDPEVIQLAAAGKFQLKDLSASNFGANKATEGFLTFSWFDNDIQGVTTPDGASIYQICFDGIGQVGSSTEIGFSESPVPFEISNSAGEIIQFKHKGSTVTVTE